MSNYGWQVIEDNGGGLHLFVFAAGESVPVYGTYNMEELSITDFLSTLERVESEDFDLCETRDWSHNYEDAAAAYAAMDTDGPGWEIIAVRKDDEREMYYDRMGKAGRWFFGDIYVIDWGMGLEDEIVALDIDEAKAIADQRASYSQRSYSVSALHGDGSGAYRPWWGVAADADAGDDIIDYGSGGYYGEWESD